MTSEARNRISPLEQLLAQLAEPFTAEVLFDQMPETVFFIKNAQGEYVCVNDTLVFRSGQQSKGQLVGRTPTQVFGDELGRSYEAQDQKVLRSGRQLLGKLELHVHRPHRTGWCLTHKLPLRDRDGKVIGLVGVSRDLAEPDIADQDFGQVAEALNWAESRLQHPPSVQAMADRAALSLYQLDRRMKRLFSLSTGQWLLKARIEQACRQLQESPRPIAQIALDSGYADQSTFTRQFRRTTGCTPSEFRRLRAH